MPRRKRALRDQATETPAETTKWNAIRVRVVRGGLSTDPREKSKILEADRRRALRAIDKLEANSRLSTQERIDALLTELEEMPWPFDAPEDNVFGYRTWRDAVDRFEFIRASSLALSAPQKKRRRRVGAEEGDPGCQEE